MPSIPIALQSYERDFESLSVERLVNCYIEQAPQSAATVLPVLSSPGLTRRATIGGGPIRGAVKWKGNNYIISGSTLWRVTDELGAVQVGSVPSDGNVTITASTRGVVMVVGGRYFYTVGNVLVEPVLPAWTGFDTTPASVTTINNTVIIGFLNSDYYAWGGPNQLGTFNAIDVARAERKTDETVRVYSDNNELLLFGTQSIEVKYDSGVATCRWKSVGAGVIERGCAAFNSITTEDNTTLWLGDDLIIYRLNGRTPQRISTHWLEYQMQKMGRVDDAFAFSHTFNGHKFYTITFPSEERTFVLDLNTGLPHERRSWNRPHYRGAVTIVGQGQAPLIGSAFDGGIFAQSNDVDQDDGSYLERLMVTPWVHTDDGNPFSVDRLEILMDTGRKVGSNDTSEAKLMMRYTDDGLNWSNERLATVGPTGGYGRKVRYEQLGQTETGHRAFEFRMTAAIPFRVVKARANIDIGQS